jgi:urease accessory protein
MNRESDSTLALARLLQLASPALPIGAYSYSQGLESAVSRGLVHDAATACAWIGDMLELVVAPAEAAMLWRLLVATEREHAATMIEWNGIFRASRETAELRAETEQMGGSLVRLIDDLGLLDDVAGALAREMAPVTLPGAFALAAKAFGVAPVPAATAYVWSWLENQVLAAVKTIPLGQVAGQRLLVDLGARMPDALALARSIADEDISTFAPGLALASSWHETQYSRLFRS